jgi:DNA-binding LacI/PurR family transcriptional regulator
MGEQPQTTKEESAMAVNIYDVAKKAGVSVVTVSRVLNNSPNVRESNRQKVMDAINELDYKPNAAARSLARGNTGMIGLVIPTIDDPFMSRAMLSAEKALRELGMFLVVSFALDDVDFTDSNCVKLFREDRVDGILIMSPIKDEGYIMELKKRDFPFVLLDQHHTGLQVPSVTVDNFYGGYQAAMSLIQGGAKKAAHICGSAIYESSIERLNGFKKALEDNGIEPDDELIVQGEFSVESGYNAACDWFKKGIIPDGIFAADDKIAFGVLDAAKKFKLKVPEDVSVIGYDDHPFASSLHPGLSTIRQPAEELGRSGVELLLDVIKGKVRRAATVTIKPQVVLRDTTR